MTPLLAGSPEISAPPPDAVIERRILRMLASRGRFDPSGLRESWVLRRIHLRQRILGIETLSAYLDHLLRERTEADTLLDTLSVQVSEFLRTPDLYAALRRRVLVDLFARAASEGRRRIRLWSAGCATGEEAYSLAMVSERCLLDLLERTEKGATPGDYRVLATDLDERAIEIARAGVYPLERLREVGPSWRERFLAPAEGGGMRVRAELQRKVRFRCEDIAAPPRPGRHRGENVAAADLILCQNVLIYAGPEAQCRALERFHGTLRRGGVLVLGRVERLPGAFRDRFRILHGHQQLLEKI